MIKPVSTATPAKKGKGKKDLTIRIEMSDNGGVICTVMDMDEPMEDKKYVYSSAEEALNKVKEVLMKESSEKDEVPTSAEDVKKELHKPNIGTTAKEMKQKGY